MSMILMAKAMQLKVGNPSRKLVLIKLADNANDKGECFPSYQHVADQCEISRRSVINHIDALCEQGLVRKVYRSGEKGNSSNIYILNLDGAKTSPHSEKSAPEVVNNFHQPSEITSPYSENIAPPHSEKSAPRTSHSFEPVNEPIIEPNTQAENTACPSEPENQSASIHQMSSKYAFEGEVIRLNHKDFAEWQSLYSNIDLVHELKRLDIEFRAAKPKNWFITASQKLNYQNKNSGNSWKATPPKRAVNENFASKDYGKTDAPTWMN
ncbi:helix-turn-helix domain-containing protein [Proteus terrae]|uniref:helix-turn-helix domain-containing protein n=1 Tax=Proteus terrae TaxID=1574161 RepID=UPI00298BE240|nr:helix-turn-helix domain-containing protein [Proteus terrae]WPD00649.1 helix-turn-helix domain-containing protein [Proteus terrae]